MKKILLSALYSNLISLMSLALKGFPSCIPGDLPGPPIGGGPSKAWAFGENERESINAVIKYGFKYFKWEWAQLEEQLASMVVQFPIENLTSVIILVTDQSYR